MDEIHAQMHYEFVVACIAILLAVRTVVVTMLASTAYNLRRIPDSTYRLDFHVKRACLRAMIYSNDTTCFNQIRMYRSTFDRLCHMLDTIGGLKPTTHMLVDEQVAMFLNILAHDHKNRVIQFEFSRSGETVSRYFNAVKRCVEITVTSFEIPTAHTRIVQRGKMEALPGNSHFEKMFVMYSY